MSALAGPGPESFVTHPPQDAAGSAGVTPVAAASPELVTISETGTLWPTDSVDAPALNTAESAAGRWTSHPDATAPALGSDGCVRHTGSVAMSFPSTLIVPVVAAAPTAARYGSETVPDAGTF